VLKSGNNELYATNVAENGSRGNAKNESLLTAGCREKEEEEKTAKN
jgi:hypothetical protein